MPAPETLVAQAGHFIDGPTGGVVPPLQPSTTFARDTSYQLPGGTDYLRAHSPTWALPERVLCELEGGAEALLFGSGMAAAIAAVEASAGPGKGVVASRAMYWGMRLWLQEFAGRTGAPVTFVDASDAEVLRAAVQAERPALVWVETPANPTCDVVDLARAAEAAHAVGARLAVDSTVPTPVHSRPLALGADLVMHAATKSLNGHSDVLAGALVTARKDEAWEAIRHTRHLGGASLGPFEAWLLLRGMRTLFVRVERSSATALGLAEKLQGHPGVERVLYAGLPSHPGHEVARRQMHGGFGGMLSILVKGGLVPALAAANRCRVFLRATSLGGVESLVEHRLSVEGPRSLSPAGLLRLSIGLESPADLWDDLDQALSG
jgi:cystathionine gamma-synthase